MSKLILDGMHYDGQPPLHRKAGVRPVRFVYVSDYNRATDPEANNFWPVAGYSDAPARRLARIATGAEPEIPNYITRHPRVYDRLNRPVVLDFEDEALMAALDVAADTVVRLEAVRWVCRQIDAMRDEAAARGRPIHIGSYYPLLPLGRNAHPNDPRYAGWHDVAERDFAPLYARFDAAYLEAYIHSPDLGPWKTVMRRDIERCRRLMPGKPVYLVMAPHYAHFADPSIVYQMLPMPLWKEAVEWALAQDDVAGICLWGGALLSDPLFKRQPWAEAAGHFAAVQELKE